jgi:hypothetical protein
MPLVPCMYPAVAAEAGVARFVADVAGVDDQQALTVFGIRAVAIGCDDGPAAPVVERETAEMLGQQDDGVALVLVGTEGA